MHTLDQLRTGQLHGTKQLNLSAGLTEFPREIFDLADTLEVLNLTGNALISLPDDLGRLRRLRVLFCSDNQFTEVPAVLGQCPLLSMVGFKANRIRTLPAAALTPALRWLILSDNQLEALPPEIGNCRALQKLMLAGNRLTALPETLAACTNLELLRLAANQLTALPKWLLTMPKLAWLAYAGNPFCTQIESDVIDNHSASVIPWNNLVVEQQLGEGASGVIYQARWHRPDVAPEAVAVKLFKGALTSDGLPQSEMAACISAGTHPNLIGVAGRVSQHPAQTLGLVLELISPAFGNLAGPPSLATCTRDVYAPGTSFTIEIVLRIAQRTAAATQHLHERGILHGDLYAHNVLATAAGATRLGDFGAASFFSPDKTATSRALQQLEVRAFSCLLEELLAHCGAEPATRAAVAALHNLRQRCAQPDVSARPLFREITAALELIEQTIMPAQH